MEGLIQVIIVITGNDGRSEALFVRRYRQASRFGCESNTISVGTVGNLG